MIRNRNLGGELDPEGGERARYPSSARRPRAPSRRRLLLGVREDALDLGADLAQVVLERLHVLELAVRLGLLDERLEERFLLEQGLQYTRDFRVGVDDLVFGWGGAGRGC